MTLVIDASVAVKWVVEETGTCEATTLLESQEPLVAPELVVAEMANVLWRYTDRGQCNRNRSPCC